MTTTHETRPRFTEAEIRDALGDLDELRRRIDCSQRSFDWFLANYSRLLAEHPHKWIAVANCEIFAVVDSLSELITARRGHPDERCAVTWYMDPDPPAILHSHP